MYFLLIALALPKNCKILEKNMLESTAQNLSLMNLFFDNKAWKDSFFYSPKFKNINLIIFSTSFGFIVVRK